MPIILAFFILAQCILADLGGFVICTTTAEPPVAVNLHFTEQPGTGFATYYRFCRDAFPPGPIPGTDLVCMSEERPIQPRGSIPNNLWSWITCEVPAEMGRTQGAIVEGFEYGYGPHTIELEWDGVNVIINAVEGSVPFGVYRGEDAKLVGNNDPRTFYATTGEFSSFGNGCSYIDVGPTPENLVFYNID